LRSPLSHRRARAPPQKPLYRSPSNAVRTLKTTVQPLNSTIPWKTLYFVANQVLPLPMLRPATNSSLYPSPTPGIWPRIFSLVPLSPFTATLTGAPQLFENPATLSPVFATLTGHVRHKSFACHSCKKHRGVCTVTYKTFPPSTSIHPPEIVSRGPQVTHRGSRSTRRQSRITSRQSLNPLESALPQNAPITLLESALTKTQHLKPFRMNTYKKTGGGAASGFFTSHCPLLSTHFFAIGNKLGSAGGLSAIASSSGNCCRSGSGTFTLEPFNMLISCSALTTPFP